MSRGGGKQLTEFLAEGQEIVESLSRELLQLESGADPERVNTVFREAHSLKGLAGMFGVERLASLAHSVEDLLDAVRLSRVDLTPDVQDLLLEAVDIFHRMLAEVQGGQDGSAAGASEELAAGLSARIATLGSQAPPAEGQDPLDDIDLDVGVRGVLTEYEEHRLRENVRRGNRVFRVRVGFDLASFDRGLAEVNQRLRPLGELVSTLPAAESGAEDIAFDLIFATLHPPAEVSGALPGLGAAVAEIPRRLPVGALVPAGSEPIREERFVPEEEEPGTLRSVSQTVRVDISRLDKLMSVVGELVLARTQLQRLAESARTGPDPLLAAELLRQARTLERHLDELQQGILEVRMVQLGQLFDKLARLVRKIAREAGKEIDLRVSGSEVELDKLIVEELSDPLMHLIRNSIDHGIERPEERQKTGKPRRGVVSLTATQKGNHVVIDVADDGRGVDEARVRAVALERGLFNKEQLEDLSRRDLLSVIFQPGFSTARFVSELSGRGVGLDVVKTNIGNLSGLIDVSSKQGEGTNFTITLPVTLAILRALVVGVEGRTFAVPLNSVLEIIQAGEGDIRTLERREVVVVRGSVLKLVRLGRLFQFSEPTPPPAKPFVVVVGLAQERVGLAVDALVGQQDIVIKSLGRRLGHVRGIAGATDLGDRRPVLVLDVGAIIEEVVSGERLAEAG